MSSYVEEQIKFSNLIKDVGSTEIENSKTINELLKIDGVSLWEIASAEMAWRHLTNIAEAKKIQEKLKVIFRPKLYKIKLINDLIINSFERKILKEKPHKDHIITLGFSPKMYNDVVQPVVRNLLDKTNFEIIVISLKDHESIIKDVNTKIVNFGKHNIKNFIEQKIIILNIFEK